MSDLAHLTDEEWEVAILNEMDARPDANCEDAYHMGITDRDLGLPSRSLEYADAHERAAYVAGKCATRRVLTAREILRELEQLRDAMDDENFWRWGGA